MVEETKDLKDFKYDLKKLKYIHVSDQKLVKFVDENEIMNKKKYIFAFDDESKEGENNKVLPLYFLKMKKYLHFLDFYF